MEVLCRASRRLDRRNCALQADDAEVGLRQLARLGSLLVEAASRKAWQAVAGLKAFRALSNHTESDFGTTSPPDLQLEQLETSVRTFEQKA